MSRRHGDGFGLGGERSERQEGPLTHVEKTREPLQEPLPLMAPDIVHLKRLARCLPTQARQCMELYASNVIGSDPFFVIGQIKSAFDIH